MSAGQQIRKGLAKEADKLRGRDMSDPQSYCPFCKRTHDAPEFIETLERIAELEAALERIQIDSDEIIIVAAQTISKYASQALANSEVENNE